MSDAYVPITSPVNINSLKNILYIADVATTSGDLAPSLNLLLRTPSDGNDATIQIEYIGTAPTIDTVTMTVGQRVLIKNTTSAYGQAVCVPEQYIPPTGAPTPATPFPPNVPGVPDFPVRAPGDAPAVPGVNTTNDYEPDTPANGGLGNQTGGVSPYNYYLGHPYRDNTVIDITPGWFGIYEVLSIEVVGGSPALNRITITRVKESLSMLPGSQIFIKGGNTNLDRQFILTTNDEYFALGYSGEKTGCEYDATTAVSCYYEIPGTYTGSGGTITYASATTDNPGKNMSMGDSFLFANNNDVYTAQIISQSPTEITVLPANASADGPISVLTSYIIKNGASSGITATTIIGDDIIVVSDSTSLQVGWRIRISDNPGTGLSQYFTIKAILSTTQIQVSTTAPNTAPTISVSGAKVYIEPSSVITGEVEVVLPRNNNGQITGTATTIAANTTITGALTLFTTELTVGDVIQLTDGILTEEVEVTVITNDTTATVSPAPTFTDGVGHPITIIKKVISQSSVGANITGTATTIATNSTVTGAGTLFLTELVVGSVINLTDGSVVEQVRVATITSNTSMTVSPAPTFTDGVGNPIYLLASPTAFSLELAAGDIVRLQSGVIGAPPGINDGSWTFTVDSVLSNTRLRVNYTDINLAAAGAGAVVTYEEALLWRLFPNTQNVSISQNSDVLNGNLTDFIDCLSIGDNIVVDPSGQAFSTTVKDIISDTQLILTDVYTGPTLTEVAMTSANTSEIVFESVSTRVQDPLNVGTLDANVLNFTTSLNCTADGATIDFSCPNTTVLFNDTTVTVNFTGATVIGLGGLAYTNPLFQEHIVGNRLETFQVTNWINNGFDSGDAPVAVPGTAGYPNTTVTDLQVFSTTGIVRFMGIHTDNFGTPYNTSAENDLLDINNITMSGTTATIRLKQIEHTTTGSNIIIADNIDMNANDILNVDSVTLNQLRANAGPNITIIDPINMNNNNILNVNEITANEVKTDELTSKSGASIAINNPLSLQSGANISGATGTKITIPSVETDFIRNRPSGSTLTVDPTNLVLDPSSTNIDCADNNIISVKSIQTNASGTISLIRNPTTFSSTVSINSGNVLSILGTAKISLSSTAEIDFTNGGKAEYDAIDGLRLFTEPASGTDITLNSDAKIKLTGDVVSTTETASVVAVGGSMGAAAVLGGIITTDTSGGAGSISTPSAAALVAATPNVAIGDVVKCLIVAHSSDANTLSISMGVGVTTFGAPRIFGNTSRILYFLFTNVSGGTEAVSVY